MDSIYLKTLVEAAKLCSFSKAAVALCITQSAVSRRIKYLEECYGQELIHRNGQSVTLTEAGKIVLEKAQKVLEIEKELHDTLLNLREKKKIAFSCTIPFGISYLPKIVKDQQLTHLSTTDLKFVFASPDKALKGVKEQQFDLAVIEHDEELDLGNLFSYPLVEDEMIFISSPRLSIPSPVANIEDLINQRLFCRQDISCAKRLLDRNMERIGRDSREFRNICFYDDLSFIVDEVASGAGISFTSRSIAAAHIARGELCDHRVDGFHHQRKRTLVVGEQRLQDPLVRDFSRCIFEEFALPIPSSLKSY